MFRRILVCTDLTDGLQRFVSKIAALHHIGVEHLVFVHCVPFWEEGEIPHEDEARIQFAQACLNPALAETVPGIEVQVEVVSGIPTDWIPKLVEKYQSDALLLGTETRSFLSEKLFGSTTAALAQRCSVPILTLRPPIVQVYRNDELTLRCENLLRELLLPFDSLSTGKCLVDQVKQLLDRQPVPHLQKCWLVAIVPPESRRLPNEYKVQEAQAYLQELKDQFHPYPITVETHVHAGEEIQDILALLSNHDISAIGVTYNWGDGLLDWSVPSFGKEIMRRSFHPVLLFPPKGHFPPKDIKNV